MITIQKKGSVLSTAYCLLQVRHLIDKNLSSILIQSNFRKLVLKTEPTLDVP